MKRVYAPSSKPRIVTQCVTVIMAVIVLVMVVVVMMIDRVAESVELSCKSPTLGSEPVSLAYGRCG